MCWFGQIFIVLLITNVSSLLQKFYFRIKVVHIFFQTEKGLGLVFRSQFLWNVLLKLCLLSYDINWRNFINKLFTFQVIQKNVFLVLCLGIWWCHETKISKILKFDFPKNEKSFWKVLSCRLKKRTSENVADTTFSYFASIWKLCQKHGVIHTRVVRWFDFKFKYHSYSKEFPFAIPMHYFSDIDGKYFAFPNFWFTCWTRDLLKCSRSITEAIINRATSF